MNREEYIKKAKKDLKGNSQKIMINQIENFFRIKNLKVDHHKYKVGEEVILKKGMVLHGTYKNYEGLEEIVKNGLLSSWNISSRGSKYPFSVGIWHLSKTMLLKEYVNYYSGGTILCTNHTNNKKLTKVLSFSELSNFMNFVLKKDFLVWKMEQTKEARFLPSLVQNQNQIGIIFNGNCTEMDTLLKGDILDKKNINDKDVKPFINKSYYENFIVDRKDKDDFFTNRESAVLFGIPSNLIEGVLVGKKYEKDKNMLAKIKKLLPDCYICNLSGKVIK